MIKSAEFTLIYFLLLSDWIKKMHHLERITEIQEKIVRKEKLLTSKLNFNGTEKLIEIKIKTNFLFYFIFYNYPFWWLELFLT